MINVRGGLGNQVLEYMVAKAKGKQEPVEVNVANTDVAHIQKNWIQYLFDVESSRVMRTQKTDAWTINNLMQLVNYNISSLPLKFVEVERDQKILHIRGGDRSIATASGYAQLVDGIRDIKILTNELSMAEEVISMLGYGEIISTDDVEDWYRCVYASEIYGAPSSFTISASMFDKNKKMRMLSKENCKGLHSFPDHGYKCIEFLRLNFYKDMEWI